MNGRKLWHLAWLLPVLYGVCYAGMFVLVNRVHGYRHARASEIPAECLGGVALYGERPEDVDVIVVRQDMDGDGQCELLIDAGEYERGAANFWFEIWKRGPSGGHERMGSFFADEYWVVPPWTIFGHSNILCILSTGERFWVRWAGDRYADDWWREVPP